MAKSQSDKTITPKKEEPLFRIDGYTAALVVLIVLALFTRFDHLERKAFHHDESLYAKYCWNFYTMGTYEYDPMQHGPFMFHYTLLNFFLFGISDYTIRMGPAIFGMMIIIMIYLLHIRIGKKAALIGVFLYTISPTNMYFNRFFRHDTFFAFFTLAIPVAYVWFLKTKQKKFLYMMTAAFALMFCVKENAFVTTVCYLIYAALFLVHYVYSEYSEKRQNIWKSFREVMDEHSFLAKLIIFVILWGMLFAAFAVTDVAYKAKPRNWESIVHIYWFCVYGFFGLVMLMWFYISGLYRKDEREHPTFMGLNAKFYRDALIFMTAFLMFAVICICLYTAFGTSPKGFWNSFWTGVYKWFRYWHNQHSIARIKGEFRYYLPIIFLYEHLPFLLTVYVLAVRLFRHMALTISFAVWGLIALFIGATGVHLPLTIYKEDLFTSNHLWGLVGILVFGTIAAWLYLEKRATFMAFLTIWATWSFCQYSYLQEKIPWLTLHIIAPQLIIAGVAIRDLWDWSPSELWTRILKGLGTAFVIVMIISTIHSAVLLNWFYEDYAVEQMVYVQTHKDMLRVVDAIHEIGEKLGVGTDLHFNIQGDSAWPLSWYLRDYPIAYAEMAAADKPVFICNWDRKGDYEDMLQDYVGYRYQLRSWWIPPTKYWFSSDLLKDWDEFVQYFLRRKKYNPSPNKNIDIYGSVDIAFWVHKDIDEISSWEWKDARGNIRVPVRRKLARAKEAAESTSELKRVNPQPIKVIGKQGIYDGLFQEPKGLCVDKDKNLYVVDCMNHRIQKFDKDGNFVKAWGEKGEGEGQFNTPTGICIGKDGTIYIADTWNHRVQFFDQDGNFKGTFGNPEIFWAPKGITIDDEGKIYVVVTGYHMVRKFAAPSKDKQIKMWGAKGEGNPGLFFEPVGIAIDPSKKVYIGDTANKRIQIFDNNGKFLSEWLIDGWDEFFSEPFLAVDKAGRVYYTDSSKNKIGIFDPNGNLIGMWGRYGRGNGEFNHPKGIFIDDDGKIYVSDTLNNRIQIFNPLAEL